MKSVTDVVIMIGEAKIFVKSSKQRIVTRSSTEAELVGLYDALSQVIWTREYLIHQGFNLGPARVYHDNKSTICLAEKERSTNERTRHVKIRFFFIHDYIENNEIIIEYLPTGKMVADILTKPLHGALFEKFRGALAGLNVNKAEKDVVLQLTNSETECIPQSQHRVRHPHDSVTCYSSRYNRG